MDYFELENKHESEFSIIYDKTDTTEYFISKEEEGMRNFSESTLHNLSVKEERESDPTRIGDLKIEDHKLQEKLANPDSLEFSNIDQFMDSFIGNTHTGQVPVCRLCAQEIYDEEMTYLHETSTYDTTTLVDKINACLPISVSLEDSLPKQICSECLANVELSYIFSQCVTSAEEKLRSLQFCSNSENMICPLCCEGCMEAVPPDTNLEEESSDEFSQLPEIADITCKQSMTNVYPEKAMVYSSVSSNLQPRKRGRPRRFDYAHLDKDDKDWTMDEEIEPVKKRRATVSNRGRPKGSRNRLTKLKNMDCFICHSKLNDFEEALQHALSAHCDSMNETFPCPLCQSITTSELELRDHIDTHNDKKEVLVIQCKLCGMEFGQVNDIHKHILKIHAICAKFCCPLCEHNDLNCDGVLSHVLQEHLNTMEQNIAMCPVCTLGVNSESELREHLVENHIGNVNTLMCPECNTEVESEEEYLNHFVEAHCATSIFKVPSSYSCCVCGNNFRSQYHLIKHTCNVVTDELFCAECDKGFPTKARFVFHLQNHQSAGVDMRCDECLLVFFDEDAFYDHVRFQHEPDEQVHCPECQKVFKNSLSLSMHMRRHQPNRDHECEECGKRFQNAQTLREHRVSHMAVKPFQCHICGAYLSRLSRLRIHLRTHSVKASKASMKAYKCSVCTQLFPNTKAAIKHSENHTDEENINLEELEVTLVFRCEFCDAFFQKTTELNTHRKENHTDPNAPNAYTCSVCGAQFSTYARVTTHKLSHGINTETLIVPDEVNTGEESFVIPQYFLCHECDKRCLHYTYMSLHRRFQHSSGKPIFTCTVCGDKFATSWSLQFHRKKQHNMTDVKDINCEGVNSLFHCRVCDKPYVTETSLEHHIRKYHENDDGDDGSNYICETCGKTFQFKSAFEAHTDAHQGLKRFKCNICDKRFTHRAGLIRHMKLHSETDTFECEFCGKKFRDRTERENHRRAHTGERPFMCDVCGRTFHTRAVWLDHSRIHQDVRPYQCDVCSQSFRRSYALKSHYLIHTGERPFSCEICGKTFRLKQTLFAHRKKEHQNNDDSEQLILPDEVLLIEEDTRYVEDLRGVETDCESLIGKNYMDSELVDNPDVPTTSSLVEKSDVWQIDAKNLLNKAVREGGRLVKGGVKNTQPFQQQKFSLLLKSQPIGNNRLS